MKCYVCGKQYEGNECPRCKFPAVEIPNTTWEQGREALAATITPFRTAFLDTIQASLIVYHHRDENGVYVLDREEAISLGNGAELYGKELWLDRNFARLEDPTIRIRLRLTVRDNAREEQVELPNLKAAELQQVGIAMDETFNIHLKLRNTSEKPTCSAAVEL